MLRLLATNNKCRVFLEKREVYQQGAHGLEADVEGSSQEQRSSSAAGLCSQRCLWAARTPPLFPPDRFLDRIAVSAPS